MRRTGLEPVAGNTLKTSLDYNIQSYCEQAAEKVLEEKAGRRGIGLADESAERRNLCYGKCA